MTDFIIQNAGALGPLLALLVGMPVTAVIFLWRRNANLEKRIDELVGQIMKVIEDNTRSTETLRQVLEELKSRNN